MFTELLEKFEDIFTPLPAEEVEKRQEEIIQQAVAAGMKLLKSGDAFNIRTHSLKKESEYPVVAKSKIFISGDWNGELLPTIIYSANGDRKLFGAVWRHDHPQDIHDGYWYMAHTHYWVIKHMDKMK